ncbi:hypothetical protein BH10ACT3_BH10ACT3_00200 [soil metagenome]
MDTVGGTQTTEVLRVVPRVVHLVGYLDLSNRESMTSICVESNGSLVTVDMSQLTFMDCAGYGALVAARGELEQRGQTMRLVGATGQPARLLKLLAELG